MFRHTRSAVGGIDVLINTRVSTARGLGWEADPGQWMRVIDVNLKGAFLCRARGLETHVPAGKGASSTRAASMRSLLAGYSAYVASKAVAMMAKTLRKNQHPTE